MYKIRETWEELSPSSEPEEIIHEFSSLIDRELFIESWINNMEASDYLERNLQPTGIVGFYSKIGDWFYDLYLEE
jgi:hypothetical protein